MKENQRKCFKCGRSASDPDTKLFRFPSPGTKNTFRCATWAKYCFPDSQWHSQEFQKKLYNEHRMLCNRHFKATSFSDWPNSMKKLHKFAVPEVTTHEEKQSVSQREENQPGPSCTEPAILGDVTNAPVTIQPTLKVLGNIKEKQSVSQREKNQPGPSCTEPAILGDVTNAPVTVQPTLKVLGNTKKKQLMSPDEPGPSHAEISIKWLKSNVASAHSVPKEAKGKTHTQVSKIKSEREKVLQTRSRKHLKRVCQLRKRLDKLKNKVLLQRLGEEPSLEKLSKSLSATFALLLQTQIKNFKKKSRGRRWTTDEKITALRLYKRSPTCYRLMRRLFCLPAPSTLKSLLTHFLLNTGINKTIFDVLGKFAKHQKPSDNEYILMFDEMSLKKNLTYNKKNDIIEGFQDHGNQGRDGQIASYALVFMVAGIRKKVKQPVAYYFSSGYVTADRLAVLIKEVLHECFQVGLNIAATVCDMDGVNRRAYAILGATVKRPSISVDNVEVIALYDTPHLLKCFRNLFMKYDIKCVTNIKSNDARGIGIAKWSHIREFYELDNNNKNFVFAPTLKREHLNPNSKQKMRVKLAAQVLSHTVAAGLMAKISEGEITGEATVTVDVIERMDKLFDALNSDSKDLRRGKPFGTNIKKNSPHIQFFREMREFFNSLAFLGCKSTPPSKEGWIWTLNAVEHLWEKIIKKHDDVESLALRRLQQDPLENLFGCIRANCGANMNPTVGQFVAALKTAMLSNLAHLSNTGNCESDNNCAIIDNIKQLLSKTLPPICSTTQTTVKSNTIEEFERFYDDNCTKIENDNYSVGETQACAYVCGFLLKKIKNNSCEQCKNILISNERLSEHRFIEFKEYSCVKESLCYCTKNLIDYIELCATETNALLKNIGHEHAIKVKITSKLSSVQQNFLNGCQEHFNENLNYFIESIFYICMKRFCVLKNRQFSEESAKTALKRKIDILTHK